MKLYPLLFSLALLPVISCQNTVISESSIDYPREAAAGATVNVQIKDKATTNKTYQCSSMVHLPYQEAVYVDRESPKQSASTYSGTACKSVTIKLPKGQPEYSVWLRSKTDNLELEGLKDGKTVFKKNKWIRDGGKAWKWQLARRGIAADGLTGLRLSAAGQNAIDCVITSTDIDFNPVLNGPSGNASLDSPGFALELPTLLNGIQTFTIKEKSGKSSSEQKIQIKVGSETTSSGSAIPENIKWLSLTNDANIGLQAADGVPAILNEDTIKQGVIKQGPLSFPIPSSPKAFVGVWTEVSEKELKERSVTVAQAGDKVESKVKLPSQQQLSVSGRHHNLAFLHTEIGAGEQGDVLWEYVVNYADGASETIKVIEGEQVAGLLKGENPAKATLVWKGLIGQTPSKVFLYTWHNPHPDKEIGSMVMKAKKKKIIPILVGLGSVDKINTVAAKKPITEGNLVEVNLAQPVRPVKEGLFSINNPFISVSSSRMKASARRLDLILSEKSWDLYHQMNFRSDRIWMGAYLAGTEDGKNDYGVGFDYVCEAAKRVAQGRTKVMMNIKPPKWSYAEGDRLQERTTKAATLIVDLIGKCRDRGWPIEYVELFNETLIRHPQAEVERIYTCFNTVAAAIKAKYPDIKIAGTAECWPAVDVIEQFVKHCGDNLDAVSWHLYPTGNTKTPTEVLMKKTPQMALSSRQMHDMLKRVRPDRKITQLITEYNINYAAWKNGVEIRQRNGIGALWVLSVLRHLLYDGEADVANYWHYAFNSCYSIGFNPGARPNPTGTVFILANNHFTGNLCDAASSSEDIEVIAVDNGKEYVLTLLNKSNQATKLKLRLFNLPDLADRKCQYPIKSYSVAGEALDFTRETLPRDFFAGGNKELEMEPFSVKIMLFPKTGNL